MYPLTNVIVCVTATLMGQLDRTVGRLELAGGDSCVGYNIMLTPLSSLVKMSRSVESDIISHIDIL